MLIWCKIKVQNERRGPKVRRKFRNLGNLHGAHRQVVPGLVSGTALKRNRRNAAETVHRELHSRLHVTAHIQI